MATLPVHAVLHASAGTASRGVVHLPARILAGLGIVPGDPVTLRGNRSTSALAALAPADTDVRLVLVDELVLANLQVSTGAPVMVSPALASPLTSLTLDGPPLAVSGLDANLVLAVLLGKVLTEGDQLTLLPQEVNLTGLTKSEVLAAQRSLGNRLGYALPTTRFTAHGLSSSPGLVTSETVIHVLDPNAPVLPSSAPIPAVVGGLKAVTESARSLLAGRPAAPFSPRPATSFPAQAQTPPPGTLTQTVTPAAAALTLENLPGLEDQARLLREWLDLGFFAPDVLKQFGTRPQMGVLLQGPAGSGKGDLLEAVANDLGVNTFRLWGPRLASYAPNDAANEIRSALSQAAAASPSALILEELSSLAPSQNATPLKSILLETLKDTVAEGKVALLATTSTPEDLAPEFLRPGVLDRRLEVPLPDRKTRHRLLEHLSRTVPLDPSLDLSVVVEKTPGFVRADLEALVAEAALLAARRERKEAPLRAAAEAAADAAPAPQDPSSLPEQPQQVVGQASLFGDDPSPAPDDAPIGVFVTLKDFMSALTCVKPSSLAGDAFTAGGPRLEDVGGMKDVKKTLTETVLWPLTYPDTFARLGVKPPRGVLLYGPPGCGKTFLVRALAVSGQANVIPVKGAEFMSKWVGDSEAAVRNVFRRARESAPSIIFFDELDALAPPRGQSEGSGVSDRVVAALLTEMDGAEALENVVVIGATNRPDLIDPALLRPGRLSSLVYAPPPDQTSRYEILVSAASSTPLADDVDLEALAAETDGFSSADCAALVAEAGLAAMRESMDSRFVAARHFEKARESVKPSLDKDQVAALERFASERAAR